MVAPPALSRGDPTPTRPAVPALWLTILIGAFAAPALVHLVEPQVEDWALARGRWDELQYLPRAVTALVALMLVAAVTYLAGGSAATIGLSLRNPTRQALWGGAGILMAYGAVAVWVGVVWSARAFSGDRSALPPNTEPVRWLAEEPQWPSALACIVSTVIMEETLYRGVLLTGLRVALRSNLVAVLVSSVAFAAAHMPGGVSYAAASFACSLVLGAVYLRAGLLAAMIAHLGFDVTQWQLAALLLRWYGPPG